MSSGIVTVQVHGLAELESALFELGEAVAGPALRSAVYSGAATIRKEAVSRAPVGAMPHWIGRKEKGRRASPGNLRKQIVIRKMRSTKFSAAYRVGVSGLGFYGKFLEFGTSKMKAQPFLRPAFDAKKEAAVEAIKQRLALNIERARKKALAASHKSMR